MKILEQAINSAGGISALAKDLGLKPNVVSMWKLRSSIPLGWASVLRYKYLDKSDIDAINPDKSAIKSTHL